MGLSGSPRSLSLVALVTTVRPFDKLWETQGSCTMRTHLKWLVTRGCCEGASLFVVSKLGKVRLLQATVLAATLSRVEVETSKIRTFGVPSTSSDSAFSTSGYPISL